MIEYKKVTKRYGEVLAIDDVSFTIDEGEFVFIVGPSGSGKTTLLKLLLGEIKPSSGKVVFDGENIGELKRKELPRIRQKIGVVFQDFRLLKERTIRENIEVALAIKGVEKEKRDKRAEEVLTMVGIGDKADQFPSQLSGGELQRASLARALVVNPKVVFADEPTGNLDWKTAREIMDLFVKVNEEGKTVIVASHHKSIIDKLGKRVIGLSKKNKEKSEE